MWLICSVMVLKSDEVRTQMQEKMGLFNNKMKLKENKNYPEGEKQAGSLGTITWVDITHTT